MFALGNPERDHADRDARARRDLRIMAALADQIQAFRSAGLGALAERTLPEAERSPSDQRRAVRTAAAWAAGQRGDFTLAGTLGGEALHDDESGDAFPAAYSALLLVAMYTGAFDEAHELVADARRAIEAPGAEASGWLIDRSGLCAIAAIVHTMEGVSATAQAEAEQGLALARTGRHPSTLAMALYALGWSKLDDDPDAALVALDECVELVRAGATDMVFAHALIRAAALRARAGDRRALRAMREATVFAKDIGSTTTIVFVLDCTVQGLAALGAAEPAAVVAGFLDIGGSLALPVVGGAELARREQARNRAQADLGPERFEQATARGAQMPYDELHVYVVTELDRLIDEAGDA